MPPVPATPLRIFCSRIRKNFGNRHEVIPKFYNASYVKPQVFATKNPYRHCRARLDSKESIRPVKSCKTASRRFAARDNLMILFSNKERIGPSKVEAVGRKQTVLVPMVDNTVFQVHGTGTGFWHRHWI